jgi:helix-turn-helix protein
LTKASRHPTKASPPLDLQILSFAEDQKPTNGGKSQMQTNEPKARRLYSRAQLAERWGCSTKTVQRLERTGKLKATHITDRIRRYSEDEIAKVERKGAAA